MQIEVLSDEQGWKIRTREEEGWPDEVTLLLERGPGFHRVRLDREAARRLAASLSYAALVCGIPRD